MDLLVKKSSILSRPQLLANITDHNHDFVYLSAPAGFGKSTLLHQLQAYYISHNKDVILLDAANISIDELSNKIEAAATKYQIILVDHLTHTHQTFIQNLLHQKFNKSRLIKLIFCAPPLYLNLLRNQANESLLLIPAEAFLLNQDEQKSLFKLFKIGETEQAQITENIPIFFVTKLRQFSQLQSDQAINAELILFLEEYLQTLLHYMPDDEHIALFAWIIFDNFGHFNHAAWQQNFSTQYAPLLKQLEGFYRSDIEQLHWAFKAALNRHLERLNRDQYAAIICQLRKFYTDKDHWFEIACLLVLEKQYAALSNHLIECDIFKKIVVDGIEKFQLILSAVPNDKFIHSPEINIARAFTIAKQGYMLEAADMIDFALQDVGVYLPLPHQLIAAGDVKTRQHIFNTLLCNSLLYFYVDKKLYKKDFLILEQMEMLLEEGDYLSKGLLANVRCYLYLRHGNFEESYQQCLIAQQNYRLIGAHYLQVFIYIHTASCLLSMSGCKAALKQIMAARKLAKRFFEHDKNLNTLINIVYADIIFEQGLEFNPNLLTDEMIIIQKEGESWLDLYIKSYRLLTSNYIMTKQISKLQNVLVEIENIAEDRQIDALNSFVIYRRLESMLIFGKHEKARVFVKNNLKFFEESYQFDENMGHWQEKIGAAQSYCRFLIDDGQHHKAINILNLLITQCQQNKAQRPLLKCMILKAYALQYTKGLSHMFEAFEAALHLGSKHDFVRVFIEESRKISILLKHWSQRVEQKQFDINEDILHFSNQIIEVRERLIENNSIQFPDYDFSKHQSNILSYLLQGLKNKEIATCLNVSESAIRFHLKKIYKKVGVSNRKKLVLILSKTKDD